jgi:hypothetical protein
MLKLKDFMERAIILDIDNEVLPEHHAQEILDTRRRSFLKCRAMFCREG